VSSDFGIAGSQSGQASRLGKHPCEMQSCPERRFAGQPL